LKCGRDVDAIGIGSRAFFSTAMMGGDLEKKTIELR
jgi:hypothetical protein